MKEPLEFLFDKYGIETNNIHEIHCGAKYCLVILKSGHMGVCSTLNNVVNVSIEDLRFPNLDNIQHRIIINAYYNASFNNEHKTTKEGDIIDLIDFKKYKSIVMVGLFRPLLKKFNERGIDLYVFDSKENDSALTSIEDIKDYISNAESIILTATSIFNKSFLEIVDNSKNNCDIFLLGPSSIMNYHLFNYKNIKVIFGLVFAEFDKKVIDIIKQGHGTRQFLPFARKVLFDCKKR